MLTEQLRIEIEKLHHRNELAKTVGPEYFEPGMMEYLDCSDGRYDADSGEIVMLFEARGTRYEGRTERIEKICIGDPIRVERDFENAFNSNNFVLLSSDGADLGFMPAELCNAIAPLYDSGSLLFEDASVSFVEPISKRSRYAKQAVLFVRLRMRLLGSAH